MKKENFLILRTNGIGFRVLVSKKTLERLPGAGEAAKLFSYLDLGERSLNLYGFSTYEELEFFGLLRNIQGVGPKAALEICSVGSPAKLRREIEKGNEKILDSIYGIGPKKAKKIILELSGKLKSFEPAAKKEKNDLAQNEVFLALSKLGFQKEEIKKSLVQIPKEIKDNQEKIKQALKLLGK